MRRKRREGLGGFQVGGCASEVVDTHRRPPSKFEIKLRWVRIKTLASGPTCCRRVPCRKARLRCVAVDRCALFGVVRVPGASCCARGQAVGVVMNGVALDEEVLQQLGLSFALVER
eukprot:scaffold8904_cov93-Isochrysis_galbana.AAC.1